MAIPLIDDRVKHVGVNYCRRLNTKTLLELQDVLVVQINEEPIAVVIPYSIYKELQDILWPISLLPTWGASPVLESNGGTDSNPDLKHSMDTYTEPTLATGVSEAIDRITALAQEDARAVDLAYHPEPPVDVMPKAPDVVVHGLSEEESKVPRGKRLTIEEARELRDNPPPMVFDDLDDLPAPPSPFQTLAEQQLEGAGMKAFEVEYLQEFEKQEPVCSHCGSPSDKPLCPDCFMAGHRSGNCLKCAESE